MSWFHRAASFFGGCGMKPGRGRTGRRGTGVLCSPDRTKHGAGSIAGRSRTGRTDYVRKSGASEGQRERRANRSRLETTLRDIRYAARVMRKAPGFTTVAVLTVALGIGANTAIFSLVNAVLLKPLNIRNPKEIVGCYSVDIHNPAASRAFSYPNYADLREKNAVFSNLAAHDPAEVGLTEGETTRHVFADVVSSNYFATVGVPLFRGRTFTAAEEKPDAGIQVAIVSYSYWKKHGSDQEMPGKTLRINGRIFTVIGIAAEGFTGTPALLSSELYLPLGTDSLLANEIDGRGHSLSERDSPHLILIGRLKSGLTEREANARLAVVASQMEKAYPAEQRPDVCRTSAGPAGRLAEPRRTTGSPCVGHPVDDGHARAGLLIASLNLANMMLARGTARHKEIAIRLAIGGGRGRIVWQLCTEGFLLAILGGAAGLLVASWGSALLIRSLVSVAPIDLVFSSKPDIRVLAATMAFCILSTIVFGLWPAWRLSRPDVTLDLKSGGEDAGGGLRRLFSAPERAGDGAVFAFADDADGERTFCSKRDAGGARGTGIFAGKRTSRGGRSQSGWLWRDSWAADLRGAPGTAEERSGSGVRQSCMDGSVRTREHCPRDAPRRGR